MASNGPDYRQKMDAQLLADVPELLDPPARPLSGNGQEIGPLLDCSRWQLRQFRRHRQGERRRARGHPAAFSTRTTTRETGILQLNVHQRRCIFGVLRQAAPSHAPAGGAVGEESAQGARSCDLEGNRAGLGCLEHLGNALSFAVVTEWPVRVHPRRRCRSPPQACLVWAVGQSSPCECVPGQNKD